MSAPLIEFQDVSKTYPAPQPLRIAAFIAAASDRIVLSGLDTDTAEMFIHLITGAAVPDQGHVRVGGRDTRDITTDTEWLKSLDRFGIVTSRAVLIDKLSVSANLALPMTLSIEPIPPDVLVRVKEEAAGAGLDVDRLAEPVSALAEDERLRLHLARAVANKPEFVLLEHPTSRLANAHASARFGTTLKELSASRSFGWIAISDDQAFAKATGGTRLKFDAAKGTIRPARRFRYFF